MRHPLTNAWEMVAITVQHAERPEITTFVIVLLGTLDNIAKWT